MKCGLKYLLCSVMCFFIAAGAKAQTFFEGVRGQSSIALPVGGIARLNTTASSLKIGYYYNRSDKNVVLGIDASGISNNGFAPLVTGKKLSPEAAIHFNLGFKNVSTSDANPSGYDYLNIRIGFGAAQYRMLRTAEPFEQQISSETFNKIDVGVSYNYILNGNMIFGAFSGYNHTNNIPYLNRLTIKETTPIAANTNGTIRTAEVEYTAWLGRIKAIEQFSLFLDYVYIPDFLSNRIAFSGYSRSYFNKIINTTNAGVGVYLNRKGEPFKIIGGLVYGFSDLFDARNSGTSLGDRATLGIVAGYNF